MIFQKKAFAIQFSWIFILIVGFMILIFVVSSISKQQQVAEGDLDVEILKNVDSIFASAEQSVDTFKTVHTPEISIEYICEDNYSAYSINKKMQKIENLVLFSPKKIVGKKFFTWSKEYKMPMKVTNILYLTNQKHKYIFINNSPVIRRLLDEFPNNITIEILPSVNEISDIEDENYDTYTIVYVSDVAIDEDEDPNDPPLINKMRYVRIDTSISSYNRGNIYFSSIQSAGPGNTKWSSEENVSYIDETMLYGAIFSPIKEQFICNMNKILRKSNTIYKIHNYTASMEMNATNKYVCASLNYPSALSALGEMNEFIESGNNEYEELSTYVDELKTANNNLRRSGCPLIY